MLKVIAILLVVVASIFVAGCASKTTQEAQVGGLVIQFKNGTTEPEVKAVLENYNMSMYKLDYNTTNWEPIYNFQVKKSVCCYIDFGNPKNWVSERYALGIKHELEMNGKVLNVSLDYAK